MGRGEGGKAKNKTALNKGNGSLGASLKAATEGDAAPQGHGASPVKTSAPTDTDPDPNPDPPAPLTGRTAASTAAPMVAGAAAPQRAGRCPVSGVSPSYGGGGTARGRRRRLPAAAGAHGRPGGALPPAALPPACGAAGCARGGGGARGAVRRGGAVSVTSSPRGRREARPLVCVRESARRRGPDCRTAAPRLGSVKDRKSPTTKIKGDFLVLQNHGSHSNPSEVLTKPSVDFTDYSAAKRLLFHLKQTSCPVFPPI